MARTNRSTHAPMADQKRITALEERQAALEKRIKDLEDEARRQYPLPTPSFPLRPRTNAPEWPERTWPARPFTEPGNPWPSPFTEPKVPWADESTTCGACGLQWKGVMGYCCSRTDCPMGAGPIQCGISTTDRVVEKSITAAVIRPVEVSFHYEGSTDCGNVVTP